MRIRRGGVYALMVYNVLRCARRAMSAREVRDAVVERTGMPIPQNRIRDYLRTVDYAGATGGGYRVVRVGEMSSPTVSYRLVESAPPPDGPGNARP